MHLPSTPKSPKWLNFWTGYDVNPGTQPPTEWATLHTVSADSTPTDGNVFTVYVLCVFSNTVAMAQDLTVRHKRRLNFRDPKV